MLRIPNCRLRWCLSLALALFACGSTGCVMGPTDHQVLSEDELVDGFTIYGFMERPDYDEDLELEIYNYVDDCWFPTPVLLSGDQILSMNRDGGFEGYGARWYYWEMTGYIPNWGWIHVGDDHYKAQIRVVRRNGTSLFTFNDRVWDHFAPLEGSLGDLWANAGSGTTITLHAYLDEEGAYRRVHPRNR